MHPESIEMLDEYYDYSSENLAFLQNKFDNLQIKTKAEIGKTQGEVTPVKEEDEDEWEDYESDEEVEEVKESKEDVKGQKEETDENEQYVLIRGYWHPLKDKIVTKKFIKDGLELNDKDEVVLPGGKILGHKKYSKYYKQNMVEVVRKKSEIIKALAFREMNRINKTSTGTVAKYDSVVKTLERYLKNTFFIT
jgi:pre-60S factor REI1